MNNIIFWYWLVIDVILVKFLEFFVKYFKFKEEINFYRCFLYKCIDEKFDRNFEKVDFM